MQASNVSDAFRGIIVIRSSRESDVILCDAIRHIVEIQQGPNAVGAKCFPATELE